MEAQGEDPAQLTYAQLMEKASQGGNWRKALELFDGAQSAACTLAGLLERRCAAGGGLSACQGCWLLPSKPGTAGHMQGWREAANESNTAGLFAWHYALTASRRRRCAAQATRCWL